MIGLKKQHLRRPRFRTGVLCLLIAVTALSFTYIAQRRAWNANRKAARQHLTELGLELTSNFLPRTPEEIERQPFWRGFTDWLLLEDNSRVTIVRPIVNEGVQSEPAPTELKGLRFFPEIEELTLRQGPLVTDDSLAIVKHLPRLHWLDLAEMPKVTGSFMASLPRPCRLRSLSLKSLSAFSSPELDELSRMYELRSLSLDDLPLLTDDSFRDVSVSPALQLLYLRDCGIGDVTLERWLRSCKLQHLGLRARVSRVCAPALSTQTELTRLQIENAPFLDEDFQFLSKCKKLYHLSLTAMPIQGGFLARIDNPDLLEILNLNSTLMTDDNLATLSRFKKLSHLDLSWTPISGMGFTKDCKWSPPLHMDLAGTHFSDEGKLRFSEIESTANFGYLPHNWSYEDSQKLGNGKFRTRSLSDPEAAHQLSVTGRSSWYSSRALSLEEEPLDNFPMDLMAPVLRLHEIARSESSSFESSRKEK